MPTRAIRSSLRVDLVVGACLCGAGTSRRQGAGWVSSRQIERRHRLGIERVDRQGQGVEGLDDRFGRRRDRLPRRRKFRPLVEIDELLMADATDARQKQREE
ncbi:MAG: hypothetical protein IPH16_05120 [Haliscomenobacter sp.]|nr:hypothetical protein [Haliscomenobacter sp.]